MPSCGCTRSAAFFFDRATGEALPYAHQAVYLTPNGGGGTAGLASALAEAQQEAAAVGHTVGMLFFDEGSSLSYNLWNFLTNTIKVNGLPAVGSPYAIAFYAVPGVTGTSWLAPQLYSTGQAAVFAGLLAPDNNGNLDFVPNDVPSIGTRAVIFATSPSGITVNGATEASGAAKPCAGAVGGYQIRIIGARSLRDVEDPANGQTFWTNGCGDATGASQAQAMDAFIQRDALASGVGPRLVFVQGVGVPQHASMQSGLTSALLSVSQEIGQLGGSPEAFFDNPDADGGPFYALVGKNFVTNGALGSSDSSLAEVTTAQPQQTKPQAALSGTLQRDRQWRFVVGVNTVGTALTGAAGSADLALLKAAQTINADTLAPTPFPNQMDAAYLKMLDYTARTPPRVQRRFRGRSAVVAVLSDAADAERKPA